MDGGGWMRKNVDLILLSLSRTEGQVSPMLKGSRWGCDDDDWTQQVCLSFTPFYSHGTFHPSYIQLLTL
jgi:hypothetical protein